MKTLYLVRHAKSSWSNSSLADYDRPLNERGKRDVITMGKRLKERGVMPSLILSSAAKRTTKPAKALAKGMAYDNEIRFKKNLYHSSILDNLKELEKVGEGKIVGIRQIGVVLSQEKTEQEQQSPFVGGCCKQAI